MHESSPSENALRSVHVRSIDVVDTIVFFFCERLRRLELLRDGEILQGVRHIRSCRPSGGIAAPNGIRGRPGRDGNHVGKWDVDLRTFPRASRSSFSARKALLLGRPPPNAALGPAKYDFVDGVEVLRGGVVLLPELLDLEILLAKPVRGFQRLTTQDARRVMHDEKNGVVSRHPGQ